MSWMHIIPKRNLGPCPQHFSWFQIDILARNEMIQGSSWSHYTCLQVTWWSKVPLEIKRTWLQEMWWSKVWFQSEMRVRNVMIQLHCDSVVMCKDFQHDENPTAKPFWLFQCCFVQHKGVEMFSVTGIPKSLQNIWYTYFGFSLRAATNNCTRATLSCTPIIFSN